MDKKNTRIRRKWKRKKEHARKEKISDTRKERTREDREMHLAICDDPSALPESRLSEENFFANHGIVLVVGIIGVAELPVRPELELEKLVAELPSVAHVVADVELSELVVGHGHRRLCSAAAF
jgi:hypothetical protein